jgi:hypothetical protein
MIDFTNSRPHPDSKDFVVFHFSQKERSNWFGEKLQEQGIFFEKYSGTDASGRDYYSVKKSDFSRVSDINDESKLKFRQPFIADNVLRYVTLFLFFLMVTLAFAGYLFTKYKSL